MRIRYHLSHRAVAVYGGTPTAGDVLEPMSRRTGKPTGTRYLIVRVVSARPDELEVRCSFVAERVLEAPGARTWPLWWDPR